MRSGLPGLPGRVAYLLRSRGAWGTLQRALAQAVSPILRIDAFYVTMQYWTPGLDVNEKWPDDDDLGTHPVIVENVEDLERYIDEIDDHFDVEEWRDFLAGSPNCFLVLSRRPLEDGVCKVLGSLTCETGLFSMWNGKRRVALPNDIVMSHESDVHPQYRGQRVFLICRKGRFGYCMEKGINRSVGTVGTHNLSSIKAHKRGNDMIRPAIKGKIRRVRVLGGLIDWMTPADKIEALIEALPDDRYM